MQLLKLLCMLTVCCAAQAQSVGPDYWGFLNREGNPPCVPMAVLDKSFGRAMSLDQVMAIWGPEGFRMQNFPLRGTSESIPMYWPHNARAPIIRKSDCLKMISWARAAPIPERQWDGR